MKPELKTAIPGPKSRALREREDRVAASGLQNYALMSGIAVESSSGSTLRDVDGNTFIDIIGGIGVNGLGHAHPRVVSAVQDQVAKNFAGTLTTEPRVKLFEKLAEVSPSSRLNRAQLYSSGAEAVESALRLAKCVTGHYEVLSFWGGFHGKTLSTISLMGSSSKQGFGPMAAGHYVVPYADSYRSPFSSDPTECALKTAEFAREQIKRQTSGRLAAIIVEPMQGTAGNIIPPKEFLPALRDLADETGALLIADEMITGFGRTGKFWGVGHTGVEPDIITLGKQFGAGFPISGLISTQEFTDTAPWGKPSGSSSSYGGNALASAAALAAIEAIQEEKLVENSQRMGEYFLSKLRSFEEKFSFVGQVRGLGLLIGLDLVEDKKSKKPLAQKHTRRIFDECVQRGLLTMAYAPSFRIQTAMNIDQATIDTAVEILEEVFTLIERKR